MPIAHERVDAIRQGGLLAHPLEQQGLKRIHIELQEQVTERGIRRWFADLQAENLVEQGQVALLLRRSLRLGEPLHAHTHQRALAAEVATRQYPQLR